MSNDFNPFTNPRDFFEAGRTFNHHFQQEEQRKLLEEQVRLQREANELEKQRLAQQSANYSETTTNTSPMPRSSYRFSVEEQEAMERRRTISRICRGLIHFLLISGSIGIALGFLGIGLSAFDQPVAKYLPVSLITYGSFAFLGGFLVGAILTIRNCMGFDYI